MVEEHLKYFYRMTQFIKFTLMWISQNLAIPFWVVGHVHLTINIYEDIHEIIASFGMNIIVAIGFWIEWKKNIKQNRN